MPASNLTCPLPSNFNPLSPNGFRFSISKIPEITFYCQEVNLPGITLESIDVLSPLTMNPFAGDLITYDELTVQFLVDAEMVNYQAVYNWLTGLGFPNGYEQYINFTNSQQAQSKGTIDYSDGTLQILTSNNQVAKTVQFIDLIPVSLGSMTFTSTATDVTYIVGVAGFKFDRYNFV